jgi:hypothetical protein
MAQGQGYTAKSIEPVKRGSHVRARLFTLAPGETIPRHFHRRTADERASIEFITFACTSMQTIPAR